MTQSDDSHEVIVHGSCVAVEGKAALFVGSSGSGKSANCLDLISRGAELVADDQTVLSLEAGKIIARPLSGFQGKIEARGIGIVSVAFATQAEVILVVDLDQTELHRLPPKRTYELMGIELDLVYGRDNFHLGAGVLSLLRGTREH